MLYPLASLPANHSQYSQTKPNFTLEKGPFPRWPFLKHLPLQFLLDTGTAPIMLVPYPRTHVSRHSVCCSIWNPWISLVFHCFLFTDRTQSHNRAPLLLKNVKLQDLDCNKQSYTISLVFHERQSNWLHLVEYSLIEKKKTGLVVKLLNGHLTGVSKTRKALS